MRASAVDVAAGPVGPPVVPGHAGVAPVASEAIAASPGPPRTQTRTHVRVAVGASTRARADHTARVAVALAAVPRAGIAEAVAALTAAATIGPAALAATLTIAGVSAIGRIRDKVAPIGRSTTVAAMVHDPRSIAATTGIGKTAGNDQHRPAHTVRHDVFPLRNPNLNNASRRSLKSLSTATLRTFGKIGKLHQIAHPCSKHILGYDLETVIPAPVALLAEKKDRSVWLPAMAVRAVQDHRATATHNGDTHTIDNPERYAGDASPTQPRSSKMRCCGK